MKIAIMGGWNTDSGASLHAELIGRQFIEMGHELKVFTFYGHAFHGTQITGLDEPYVTRCFTHSRFNPVTLEAKPFLVNDYEMFIVEDLGMLPKDDLSKIFYTHIKKKAKTISVFHDNQLSNDPAFYQFDWDAIVSFDNRFKEVMLEAYSEKQVHIIPYPCLPWKPGNKKHARDYIGLPDDKKILLSFGPNSSRLFNVIENIDDIIKKYNVLLLILSKDKITIQKYKELKEKMKWNIEIREEAPSLNRVYKYLHASDLMLYYRKSTPNIVVASTILQCLGAGCPIVANDTRYTELYCNEIFKYNNPEEINQAIENIFGESDKCKEVLVSSKKYTEKNSSASIAGEFIKLYNKL
jgi:hypothetical protein